MKNNYKCSNISTLPGLRIIASFIVCLALVASLTSSLFLPGTASASSLPTFSCSTGFYEIIRGDLHFVDDNTGQRIPQGPDNERYNAFGYNVNDNYMYGVNRDFDSATIHHLVRMGSNGVVDDLGDIGVSSLAGDMDRNNNLYLVKSENELHMVNVNTLAVTNISFSGAALEEVLDVVYLEADNGNQILVGVEKGHVHYYNLTTRTASSRPVKFLPTQGVYGAIWTASNGSLYASRNNYGTIYEITDPLQEPTVVSSFAGVLTENQDGASCPLAPPPFVKPQPTPTPTPLPTPVLTPTPEPTMKPLPEIQPTPLPNIVPTPVPTPSPTPTPPPPVPTPPPPTPTPVPTGPGPVPTPTPVPVPVTTPVPTPVPTPTPIPLYDISGVVFEDLNYGGGAGRPFGSSGTVGLSGTRVELYDHTGEYLEATNTGGGGTYSFNDMLISSYYVRVVNNTVRSSRPGATGSEIPVMTYRRSSSSEVGGRNTRVADAPANGGDSNIHQGSAIFTSGSLNGQQAQSMEHVALSGPAPNIDFGFNFNTVVNIEDSGTGSLRQFIENNNRLSSVGITQELPGGIGGDYESGDSLAIFMIPAYELSAGRAYIELNSRLSIESNNIVLDGRLQAINIGTSPGEVVIQSNNIPSDGVYLNQNANGSVLREIAVERFGQNGVVIHGTEDVIINEARIQDNGQHGVLLENDASRNLISNSSITFNAWAGIGSTARPDNTFTQNKINRNGGLGIDLGLDGVTENSATDLWLDYPDLEGGSVSSNGSQVVLYDFDLEVPSNSNGYRVEFFKNGVADPSGHGEGRKYMGHEDITQTGSAPRENFKGSINASDDLNDDSFIAMTLTQNLGGGLLGGTSEFSGMNNGTATVCTDLLTDPTATIPNITLDENSSQIVYLETKDEFGNPITYAISSGADGDFFTIKPAPPGAFFDCLTVEFVNNDLITSNRAPVGSAQRFAPPPGDFEVPQDNEGSDNIYEFVITASNQDGSQQATKAVSVEVQNVNEKPRITTDSTLTFTELKTEAVTGITAFDPDTGNGDGLLYRISGGADSGLFTVDTENGELRFTTPPNFDSPLDANSDNGYEITVQATDSLGYAGEKSLRINVADDPNVTDVNNGGVNLRSKALLQGAFDAQTGLMHDTLRSTGILPAVQPFNREPFSYEGTEAINLDLAIIENENAPVDWVLLELRNSSDPSDVIATKPALIERDGDIIDAVNGATLLNFPVSSGSYYLSLRQQNHLGVMTATPLVLNNTTGDTLIDFSNPNTETLRAHSRVQAAVNGEDEARALLRSGDLNQDNRIIANGAGNDLNLLFQRVLSAENNDDFQSNYVVPGYKDTDLNMDGLTIFTGPDNDANLIIGNILLHPDNDAFAGNYIINGDIE